MGDVHPIITTIFGGDATQRAEDRLAPRISEEPCCILRCIYVLSPTLSYRNLYREYCNHSKGLIIMMLHTLLLCLMTFIYLLRPCKVETSAMSFNYLLIHNKQTLFHDIHAHSNNRYKPIDYHGSVSVSLPHLIAHRSLLLTRLLFLLPRAAKTSIHSSRDNSLYTYFFLLNSPRMGNNHKLSSITASSLFLHHLSLLFCSAIPASTLSLAR